MWDQNVESHLTTESQDIAKRIRTYRIRKGWDVGQLAARANVSRTTLYNLERGRTLTPRGSTIQRVADALEVSIEQLLDYEVIELDVAHSIKTSDRIIGDHQSFDRRTNPVIDEVCCNQPQLFHGWDEYDWDELYSTFGTGGALNQNGVIEEAQKMNQNRETVHQLQIVLETHLGDVAIRMIETLHQMVRPKSNLAPTPELADLLAQHDGRQQIHPDRSHPARIVSVSDTFDPT